MRLSRLYLYTSLSVFDLVYLLVFMHSVLYTHTHTHTHTHTYTHTHTHTHTHIIYIYVCMYMPHFDTLCAPVCREYMATAFVVLTVFATDVDKQTRHSQSGLKVFLPRPRSCSRPRTRPRPRSHIPLHLHVSLAFSLSLSLWLSIYFFLSTSPLHRPWLVTENVCVYCGTLMWWGGAGDVASSFRSAGHWLGICCGLLRCGPLHRLFYTWSPGNMTMFIHDNT